MQFQATTATAYLSGLPEERQAAMQRLRTVILENLPEGFAEAMSYGMIGYGVPHSLYPKGYHCNPEQPLPFMSLASQKNFIAVYHMGLYADKDLLDWFVAEYPKRCSTKLDIGKGCVRFKKIQDIPYALIGELASKKTPQQWIELYEQNLAAGREKK